MLITILILSLASSAYPTLTPLQLIQATICEIIEQTLAMIRCGDMGMEAHQYIPGFQGSLNHYRKYVGSIGREETIEPTEESEAAAQEDESRGMASEKHQRVVAAEEAAKMRRSRRREKAEAEAEADDKAATGESRQAEFEAEVDADGDRELKGEDEAPGTPSAMEVKRISSTASAAGRAMEAENRSGHFKLEPKTNATHALAFTLLTRVRSDHDSTTSAPNTPRHIVLNF